MRIQHFTAAPHLNPALMINLCAKMADVLIKDGFVITIMIVVMEVMKENSAMLNTRLVQHKNSLVKTLNASEINIDVMVSSYNTF